MGRETGKDDWKGEHLIKGTQPHKDKSHSERKKLEQMLYHERRRRAGTPPAAKYSGYNHDGFMSYVFHNAKDTNEHKQGKEPTK